VIILEVSGKKFLFFFLRNPEENNIALSKYHGVWFWILSLLQFSHQNKNQPKE
jgi:hypothetical protein